MQKNVALKKSLNMPNITKQTAETLEHDVINERMEVNSKVGKMSNYSSKSPKGSQRYALNKNPSAASRSPVQPEWADASRNYRNMSNTNLLKVSNSRILGGSGSNRELYDGDSNEKSRASLPLYTLEDMQKIYAPRLKGSSSKEKVNQILVREYEVVKKKYR